MQKQTHFVPGIAGFLPRQVVRHHRSGTFAAQPQSDKCAIHPPSEREGNTKKLRKQTHFIRRFFARPDERGFVVCRRSFDASEVRVITDTCEALVQQLVVQKRPPTAPMRTAARFFTATTQSAILTCAN